MPFTVRIDPVANSQQAQIIPDATPKSAGVMSPADKKKLDSLPPASKPTTISGTTTDGSPHLIGTFSTHGDGAYIVQLSGVCSDTGAGNAGSFIPQVYLFIVQGGVITNQLGITTIFPSSFTGVAGSDYVLDPQINGANIDIVVTGSAGISVNWKIVLTSVDIIP